MSTRELFAYLHLRNAADAIQFHIEAFGAEEKLRLTEPGGRVGHAELEIGPHHEGDFARRIIVGRLARLCIWSQSFDEHLRES